MNVILALQVKETESISSFGEAYFHGNDKNNERMNVCRTDSGRKERFGGTEQILDKRVTLDSRCTDQVRLLEGGNTIWSGHE